MVKQVGVHKIAVALVVGAGQAAILVQVDGAHLGEVQLALAVHADEVAVNGHRRAARGKAQLGVGFVLDEAAEHIRHHGAAFFVIGGDDYFHNGFSSCDKCKVNGPA